MSDTINQLPNTNKLYNWLNAIVRKINTDNQIPGSNTMVNSGIAGTSITKKSGYDRQLSTRYDYEKWDPYKSYTKGQIVNLSGSYFINDLIENLDDPLSSSFVSSSIAQGAYMCVEDVPAAMSYADRVSILSKVPTVDIQSVTYAIRRGRWIYAPVIPSPIYTHDNYPSPESATNDYRSNQFKYWEALGNGFTLAAPVSAASGSVAKEYTLKSVSGDYITGEAQDSSSVIIAKPYRLRHSIVSSQAETINFTYTYGTLLDNLDGLRFSNDNLLSPTVETQLVIPRYNVGDKIYGVTVDHTGVSYGNPSSASTVIDMNVDGRSWARKY